MSSDEKPTISIYACILPRLEAFYLEEWVVHHLGLGVTHFHLCLYDTDQRLHQGTPVSVAGSEELFTTWSKKPEADYFLDFTDEEIACKIAEVVEKYPITITKLSELPSFVTVGTDKVRLSRQYRYHVERNKSDWWLRIDPDEYILLRKHDSLSDLMRDSYFEDGTTCFRFKEKIFQERQRGRLVRSIFDWAYINSGVKSLIISDIKTYHEHRAQPSHGLCRNVPRSAGVIFHYRGHPNKHMVFSEKSTYR